LFLTIYLAAAFVVLRLALLLPARAVNDLSVTFKQMWNRTQGNVWRLFWGLVACSAPPLLVAGIAFSILVGVPDPLRLASGEMIDQWVVNSVVSTSYYLLVTPIWIGFLSYAYQYFFRRA
jgi:membrane-anchored glycerophosphoryl diester phosphodiesterase (GDPDase)